MKTRNFLFSMILILSGCGLSSPTTPTKLQTIPPSILLPTVKITPSPTQTIRPDPTKTSLPPKSIPITLENAGSLVESASLAEDNASLLAWLPESNTLVIRSQQKVLWLNGTDLSTSREYSLPEDSGLLDFNAASQLMALTTDRMSLSIHDSSGKIRQTITPPGGFGSASFSPDGKQIWLSSMQEIKAIAFDVQTGKETASCGGFETAAPVYSAFPSPQGHWLVWIARATIQLNRLPDCQLAAHIGHEDFIISHTFSHDESILVTSTGGTVNGEFQPLIFFWDAKTGKQIRTLTLKETPAMGLAYSPDDSLLASAGSGLFIWDANTGKEIKMIAPADHRFTSVLFSPDGRFLAASTETDIRLFAVQP